MSLICSNQGKENIQIILMKILREMIQMCGDLNHEIQFEIIEIGYVFY